MCSSDLRAAIQWTAENITGENLEFLKTLKTVKVMESDNLFLVHSTPKEPDAWHYLLTLNDAEVNFRYFEQKICLIGHSHCPFIVEKQPSGELILHRKLVSFSEAGRYIINVGSVGQPRDRDPRAAYAVLTSDGAEIIRVDYDFGETQEKMKRAGLSVFLIERLEKGI